MHIWMAAAEAGPLAQTGGLGDVLRALPPALARLGHTVRRFLPAYAFIDRAGFVAEEINVAVPLGPARVPVRFLDREDHGGVTTTLVVNDELFARDGIYGPPGGAYRDNARRFALLSRAVCEYAARTGRTPDVLHVHDWHTALVPLFLRFAYAWPRPPRAVLTIHNLGYQGRFGAEEIDWLSLSDATRERVFRTDGIEDHGGLNLLKAGLVYADRITAVSPTYAREIVTPEGGSGLHEILRRRGGDLVGILNGADYDLWNPAADRHLPRPYDAGSLEGKEASHRAVREAFGLPAADRPLLGVVSRFVHQKGIDVVAEAVPDLVRAGADLVLLGAGEDAIAGALDRLRREHPRRVGLHVGYDERLAHRVVAGSDLLLVPSRYEPCGLTQMHALRYGTPPVVTRTGGLADTVRDEGESPGSGTGFVFAPLSPVSLVACVRRALDLRASSREAWRSLQRRAMAADFSWSEAARRYADLYRRLLG